MSRCFGLVRTCYNNIVVANDWSPKVQSWIARLNDNIRKIHPLSFRDRKSVGAGSDTVDYVSLLLTNQKQHTLPRLHADCIQNFIVVVLVNVHCYFRIFSL